MRRADQWAGTTTSFRGNRSDAMNEMRQEQQNSLRLLVAGLLLALVTGSLASSMLTRCRMNPTTSQCTVNLEIDFEGYKPPPITTKNNGDSVREVVGVDIWGALREQYDPEAEKVCILARTNNLVRMYGRVYRDW